MSSWEMDVWWRVDAQGTEAEEERAFTRCGDLWRRMPVGGVGRHAGRASYNEVQLVSSCPIHKPLFHGEGPPLELLLVPATFNIRTVPEGSSIYAGKGVNLYVNDFDRVPRTSASALKSSMRCSARMFVIGNTTMMVLSAFSCSNGE